MGIADSFGSGVNAIGDLYRNQQLHDQLQTYPDLLQAQLQQNQGLASIYGTQAQYAPQMAQADLIKANLANQYYGPSAQANINLTNQQANQAGTNTGLIGSETQKNQFMINNPNLMLPGIAGQIGAIDYLQNNSPKIFNSGSPTQIPVTNGQSMTGNIMPPSPVTGGLANLPMSASGAPLMPPMNNNQQALSGLGTSLGNNRNMFGGNPIANSLLQRMFLPAQKDLAQMQYYNAKTNQLAGQQEAGKNPMMGSNSSGAGGTYVNPTTGVVTSTDTGAQTTRDQRTIAGLKNAQQYLGNVVNTMPQFVTGWQRLGKDTAGFANNWLGANYKSPSDYAEAQASLKSAAEGILNGFQLNSTGENFQKVLDIMRPVEGESSQYYQERVKNQLGDFADQQYRAADRLAAGTQLNNPNQSVSPSQNQQNVSPISSQMIKIQGGDGKIWNIPANNLSAALKRGAKQVQ